MDGYFPETYGDRIAGSYDGLYPTADPDAIDLLAEVAGGDPALELGIGTGRFALPLRERGVDIHGIDASEAMIERLRAKPEGAAIPVTLADFEDFRLDQRFGLVFVVFNTIFVLLTQEAQIRCFRTVAAHLRPGGRFLIEAFVPDLSRFDRGQRVSTARLDATGALLEVSKHDPVAQTVDSQMIRIGDGGLQLFPIRLRYAWPSELDLLARLAGLELEHRWGGWKRAAFGAASEAHISVYRAAGGD
jgi:SAM-dependent methyltransferase